MTCLTYINAASKVVNILRKAAPSAAYSLSTLSVLVHVSKCTEGGEHTCVRGARSTHSPRVDCYAIESAVEPCDAIFYADVAAATVADDSNITLGSHFRNTRVTRAGIQNLNHQPAYRGNILLTISCWLRKFHPRFDHRLVWSLPIYSITTLLRHFRWN